MADLDVDDISQLERLDNNSIRQVLKTRYVKDKMYTNCGDILISVNPYKDLNIFDGKKHEEYSWKSLHHVHPPHVFHMTARAYRRLQETRTNQVILVGGESGAGKTENAKYIVKHLMAMCPQKSDHLHQRIIKVNPLLEAFGNAKTTLNENSSRFAKYLELAFSVDGQIKGAIVRDYLLEKSRVVNQADKEGNFHIFYSLFAGAPTAMLKSLRLKDAHSYRILQRNKDLLSRREIYRVMYLEQMEVLKSLDMDQQDIDIIHTVLAAILHITQVEFIEPEDPNQPLQIRDISVLENVADLLTVPYEELGHSLIATKQTFAGEVIVKRKSMCQAIDSRDAFAKALYERLFGWIVRQINMNLYPTRLNDTGGFVRIGILDIAGFENLTFNSLEQMCINLTNEKLQSFTNMNTVDFEMSLYKEEGIQIPDIKYKKDDAVLNMFMKKTFGVLPLLDEESKLAQGSNDRLIKNMKDQYENLECFMASPSDQAVFGVKHFAGQVWYDASMLIEKNRDMLSPDLITCMKQSTNPFVSDLFTAKKGPTGTISATVHKIRKSKKEAGARPTESAGRPTLTPDLGATLQMRYGKIESSTSIRFSPKDQRTVISYFQTSMNELLSKLKQAEPHYVRCIKPNTFLQPDNFDDEKVVQQIVYNGISEVAKIRTLGLPVRKRYDVFTKRYGSLFPQSRTAVSPRAGTYLLLQKILPSYMMPGIRFGNTKVFMKEDVSMLLEQCRVIRDRTAANCIAKHWQEHYQNRRRHQDEAKTRLTTASYVSSPEWETSTPESFKTSFDSKSWEASTPESFKTSFDSKSWEASTPESFKTSFDSKSWEASTPESFKTSFDSKSWEASTPESFKTSFDSKSWEASTPESSKTSFDSKSWEASTPESFKTSFDSKSWEASTPESSKTSFDSKSWEASTPASFKTSFDSKSWEASTPESSKTSFDSKRSIGKEEDYTFFNWSDNTNLKNSISYKTYTDRKPKKKKAPTPPAVSSILKNIDGTEEEQNQASKIPKKLKKEFWDIFHIINRETKRDSFNIGGVMRTLKIFTYILLGLLLLACSVFQKISLVTLVSDTSKFQHVLLLVVTCIPYIRLFLTSVWTSLFGNVPFPSKKNVVIVLISEGLHSVGLSLLIFRVLPEIDVVRSILLLSCACITPSILKPFCSSTKDSNTQRKSKAGEMFTFVFDILAALIQISVIPVIVLTDYYINNAHFAENDWKIVEMGFALILCSLPYWENFVDDRFCGALNETNSLQILILGLKFDLQECRPVLYAIAAPIKILITGLLAFYLNEQEYRSDLQFLSLFTEVWSTELFTDIPIVLALSAFVGHFVAYTACKVNMQIFSFAVPLLVSTPLAAYILYADCQSHVLPGIFKEERICDGDLLKTWWHLPIAGGWLISVYWIGRHIWFPSQPRLSNLETLFLNPVYCGVLMEQDLIMKRRRHKRKIFKVISKGRTFYRLKPDDMRDSNLEDKETTDVISPMVYACATMWHETRQEMVQLLKSLFRMDKDQFLRKKAITTFDVTPADVDYYEYEPHIFFDDAFETNADNERVPNSFVNEMVAVMEEAASSVHEKALTINDAIKIPTPYGGQLVFLMPGGNFLFVHLKDKKKIRNKKRWSQVMYMYYLLGYRILKECQEVVLSAINRDDFNQLISWRKFQKENTGKVEKSQIFSFLDDEVLYRAQNTFLLALDGDVEFSPEAVHLLIDKLKKNDRVGAVSGRIHPVGKGPVVWFQTFEYAMGHWLQKATEHVIGCVLCSPGCFSIFRGSSLMDDNVMRKFTILPSEPSHYLMYDQGEDRWLCTLLLQQGYRVEYAAAADAFTYAPEGFEEFFNQRRRWIPSTIANIMELLQDGKNTVAINNNISWFYIAYQYFLMAASVLGPGVIVMMIAGAFGSVFGTDITTAYLLATLPAVLYIFLCFNATPKSQIIAAQILGVCYIFVMTVVFIGCLIIATQENALHPSVIFIESLIILTFLTACFHPHEFGCIMHGALYYLCIPLGYLLLVTYSLCNMHIISWGTRESQEKKTPHEIAEEEKLRKEKEERKKQGFLARLMPKLGFSDIVDVLTKIRLKNNRIDGRVDILRAMNKKIELLLKQKQNVGIGDDIDMQDAEVIPEVVVLKKPSPTIEKTVRFDGIPISSHREEVEELGDAMNSNTKTEMLSPNWEKLHTLGNGRILKLNPAEEDFWKSLIKRYLYPLNLSAASQKQIKTRLLEFRNSSCAAIAILNLVWIAINFMFQLRKPAMIYFAVPSDVDDADVNTENFQVDVLGMLFVLFFSLMILIQFIGMLVHRWGTFLHLISITFIPNPFQRKVEDTDIENGNSKYVAEKLLEFCGKLDSERISDFPMNSDDEEEEEEQVIGAMVEVINNIQVKGTKSMPGSTNPLGKSIRQSGIGISSNWKTSVASILVKSVIRRTTVRENRLLDINVEKKTEKSSNTFKDTSKDNPRLRSGASMPFQRHFMSAVRNRKLPNIPEDFLKKERPSQTLRRDGYDPDAFDDSEEDSDPIYDTIPAVGVMDKAFSMKLKKYRHQEQRSQLNGTWRSELNAL
ncbi:uncharacterized protein LOC132560604 [Ylistrum balloti]|uniref:uncharacterized protein LOC132560604 n=1 Tax=Ylistrum balloti TaxID=509963 RepID=UPI0029058D30|nr:uncharacterized protein LOC132560604 [Ylistrum balloti]